MTNNVGLTFSVGDTTLRFARQLELVTSSIILSVDRCHSGTESNPIDNYRIFTMTNISNSLILVMSIHFISLLGSVLIEEKGYNRLKRTTY